MIGPISRIIARYLAGALVAGGFLDPVIGRELGADPDIAFLIQTGIGGALMAITEGWYWFAKRMGWAT
jgi:UPF0716 family protein affecting phage T7 exclusion